MHIITVLNFSTILTGVSYEGNILAADWSYDKEDDWPEMCQIGRKQSPISLSRANARKIEDHTPFIFKGYNVDLTTFVKNNGHSVEIRAKSPEPIPEMYGGGLPTVYQFDHIHFHWQSEHVMENTRYPLEIHFVHYAKEYKNLTNALKYRYGVAVLGVFGHLSPDEDKDFENLVLEVDDVKNDPNTPVQFPQFSVSELFPRDMGGYFRYEGSLTNPGCNEGIIWTVFTDSIPISQNQVKKFQEIRTDHGLPLTKNYRSLQKINGRTIFLRESPIPLPPYLVNLNHGNVNGMSIFCIFVQIFMLFFSVYKY